MPQLVNRPDRPQVTAKDLKMINAYIDFHRRRKQADLRVIQDTLRKIEELEKRSTRMRWACAAVYATVAFVLYHWPT